MNLAPFFVRLYWSRGFGSGGKQIGLQLSSRLGIPCYESQILSLASDFSGLNKNLFAKTDENIRGLTILDRLMKSPSTDYIVHPNEKSFTSNVNLFNIQAEIIRTLAKKQSCIIIGKCSNWLLEILTMF